MVSDVKDFIRGVLDSLTVVVDNDESIIRSQFDAVNLGAKEAYESSIDALGTQISREFIGPRLFADNTDSLLHSFIDELRLKTKAVIDKVEQLIPEKIRDVLDPLLNIVNTLQALPRLLAIDALGNVINQDKTWSGIIKSSGQTILSTATTVADDSLKLASGLSSIFPVVQGIEGLGFLAEKGFEKLGDKIEEGLKNSIGNFFGNEDFSKGIRDQVTDIVLNFEDNPETPDWIKKLTAPGFLPVGVLGGYIAALLIGPLLSTVISTAISPFLTKMQQYSSTVARQALLPLPDLLALEKAELKTDLRATIDAEKQGYTDDDIKDMRRLLQNRPQLGVLFDMWHRDIVQERDVDLWLKLDGWNDDLIRDLKEASWVMPSAADLIRMSVREVFSPKIAEAFGQFEDVPDEYLVQAKKVGLQEDWAINYWAAHWVLPGITQGFRMLHRTIEEPPDKEPTDVTLPSGAIVKTVIDKDEMGMLFKALDVMPFWRDKLTQIAYTPFSRVDIRRMHKLGVLVDDQVFKAYLDLGYDRYKAQNQLDFSIAAKTEKPKVEKVKERDLTTSQVLRLQKDGLLLQPEAIALLIEMDYDQNEAELLTDRVLLDLAQDERKDELKIVIDRFRVREIDYETAQSEVGALDLTEGERLDFLRKIELIRRQKTTMPSRSDLESFLKLKLIEPEQFNSGMEGLGYSDAWIDLYRTKLTMDTDIEPTTRELTTSQVIRSYKDDLLTPAEVTDRLSAIGYSEPDILLLLGPEFRTFTTSQILASFKKGLILEDVALRRLLNIDYSVADANLLLQQPLEEEIIEEPEDPRLLSVAQIRKAVKDGFINEESALYRLSSLGYSRADSLILLSEKEKE